ncbi:hypothetical protein [Methanolobus halotolerans]|uniref:Uncharacterized protein n=1 Tax=Methanolobus halotolerans TaxID=2052935 RepID=A0A4E0Q3L0_9EURY|nr:hypothetical protein [Methanolobus halotolerans]TGC08132.1 hypothetical protein CUN85_09930 [Methanolobus halotolerans]
MIFDGSTVSVIRETEISVDVPFKETTLLSGKVHIQASAEQRFSRTFECYTEDFSEISTLLEKLGSSGTLVIDSDSYTSCYIVPPLRYKEVIKGSGKYTYTITFVRHTA